MPIEAFNLRGVVRSVKAIVSNPDNTTEPDAAYDSAPQTQLWARSVAPAIVGESLA